MPSLDSMLFLPVLLAALGCGLVAGIFLAFSNFVMQALGRIEPESGMTAMQSINVTVLNRGFLGLFLGTAAVCLLLAAAGSWRWPEPGSALLLIGSLAYLFGTLLVTMVFNVPRNEALARLDGSAPESTAFWFDYVTVWTWWNHVRTIAALAASIAFVLALTRLPAGLS